MTSTAAWDARAALERLAGEPVWQLSDDELGALVGDLRAVARLADAQAVRALGEAVRRGSPVTSGAGTPAAWVRQVVPSASHRDASRLARLAGRLYPPFGPDQLVATREAFEAGRLALDQADAVSGALDQLLPPSLPAGVVDDDTLGDAEARLLADADWMDARELGSLGRRLRDRLDPDRDERLHRDAAERERVRSFTLVTDAGTGLVHVDGTLTPSCGAALRRAIDALSAPVPAQDGSPDLRSAAQRRHDGLQALCERAMAAPGLLAGTHGRPCRVTVSVPFETVRARAEGGQAPARWDDGDVALAPAELDALLCEAEVVPLLVDEIGHPLDVGDTQRLFTPRQRAALVARDRGCTYPGCGAPAPWCDAHHVVWASRGGPTSLVNGALLCGRHHRHVHRYDLSAELVEGRVVWSTTGPDGRPVRVPPVADRVVDELVRRWRARRAAVA